MSPPFPGARIAAWRKGASVKKASGRRSASNLLNALAPEQAGGDGGGSEDGGSSCDGGPPPPADVLRLCRNCSDRPLLLSARISCRRLRRRGVRRVLCRRAKAPFDGVLGAIELHLAQCRSRQIDAAAIAEPHEIEQAVCELLPEVGPVSARPLRKSGRHLAAPLEELGKLAYFADEGEDEISRGMKFKPAPL